MADRTALALVQEAWDKWLAADLEGFLGLWDPSGLTNACHSQISGPTGGLEGIAKPAQIIFRDERRDVEGPPP
jgi:hypothetical protein